VLVLAHGGRLVMISDAAGVARLEGRPSGVDEPRNLAKSVKVE
jgi:hypothetical protein